MPYEITWPVGGATLRLLEPTRDEVAAAAPVLAGFYNEPYNRSMMAHAEDRTVAEVVEHFERLWDEGGRPLLLERDGALLGDADLRRFEGRTAEFAIMVGARAVQGQGLGLRFGLMAHVLAFDLLDLERVYASIIPANRASLRMFEKLGYERDDSPAARACADEDDDVTLSLPRARFRELHGAALAELSVATR